MQLLPLILRQLSGEKNEVRISLSPSVIRGRVARALCMAAPPLTGVAHGAPAAANGVGAAQPLYSFAASQDGDEAAQADFSFLEFGSQNPGAPGAASLGEFDYADFSATGSQSQGQSAAGASQTPSLAFEENFGDDGLQRQSDQPRQLPEHACKCALSVFADRDAYHMLGTAAYTILRAWCAATLHRAASGSAILAATPVAPTSSTTSSSPSTRRFVHP